MSASSAMSCAPPAGLQRERSPHKSKRGGSDRAMPAGWYAVQTKRYSEGRVSRSLTRSQIPAFLPLIEVTHRSRGRRCVSLEPLFPCYLFAQMERLDHDPGVWHSVRWAPGVRSILGADDEPI